MAYRVAVFLVSFALAFIWEQVANADSARCTALGTACKCEETLDTDTYDVVGCGSSLGGVCDVDPTGDGGTKQCSQSVGNSLLFEYLGSTPQANLPSVLVPTIATGMPVGNSVTRVWRLARADRVMALFGDDLQTSTRRVCQRYYMQFSPNHDGGPTINCSDGKFIHMGFNQSPGNQIGMSTGGTHGRTAPILVTGLGPWGAGVSLPSTGSMTSGDCYAPNWCRVEQCVGGNFETGAGSFFAEANAVQVTGTKRKDWPRANIGTGPGTPLTNPGQVWALIDGYAGGPTDGFNCNTGYFGSDRTNEWRQYSYAMQAEFTTDTPGNFIGASPEVEGGGTPDTDPPTVNTGSTTPLNGATDVAIATNAVVTFSEPMSAASLTTSTVQITDGGSPVAATVTPSGATATVDPTVNLAYNHVYGIKVTTGVTDAAAIPNHLASEFTSSFTTIPASAGSLSLSSSTYSQTEGTATDSTLCGTVLRTGGSGLFVDVDLHTSSVTADEGTDFTEPNLTLHWADDDNAAKPWCITITKDALDEGNQTFTITLSNPTNGASLIAPSSATATILDDDAASRTASISPTTATMVEDDGAQIITGTLSPACSSNQITVVIAFTGTASHAYDADPETDYTADRAWFTFAPGQTTDSFSIHGLPDAISDNNETVIMTLDNAGVCGAETTLIAASPNNASTTTITEVASVPSVTLSVDTATVAPENGGTAVFTASLSGPATGDVVVDLTSIGTGNQNGVAGLATDYIQDSFTITITDDVSSSTFVTSVGDSLDEVNETITVAIASVTPNAVIGATSTASTAITDDDNAPTVTLACDDLSIAEAGGVSVCTATASAVSAKDMTVSLSYATGTATFFNDYTRSSVSILIPVGSTTGTVLVTAIQDGVDDEGETVIVEVDGCTNCTETGTQSVTITITDDDDTPPPPADVPCLFIWHGRCFNFELPWSRRKWWAW